MAPGNDAPMIVVGWEMLLTEGRHPLNGRCARCWWQSEPDDDMDVSIDVRIWADFAEKSTGRLPSSTIRPVRN